MELFWQADEELCGSARYLQKGLGLTECDKPLVACITRLVPQKVRRRARWACLHAVEHAELVRMLCEPM